MAELLDSSRKTIDFIVLLTLRNTTIVDVLHHARTLYDADRSGFYVTDVDQRKGEARRLITKY